MLSAPETTAPPTFETADATSGNANITKDATPGVLWVIDWIVCSASDNVHDANIVRIFVNDVSTWKHDLIANETTPYAFEFPGGFYAAVGDKVQVRLTLPTGAVGKLSVRYR